MIYTFEKFIKLIDEGLLNTTDDELAVRKSSIFLSPIGIIY